MIDKLFRIVTMGAIFVTSGGVATATTIHVENDKSSVVINQSGTEDEESTRIVKRPGYTRIERSGSGNSLQIIQMNTSTGN